MRWHLTRRTGRLAAAASLPIALLGAMSLGAGGAAAAAKPSTTANVNVVGYSIDAGVFGALEAAFQKTTAGKHVTFSNSFGASTTQADAVVAGQAADIVNFSTEPDLQQLVDNGIVSSKWNTTGAGRAEGGYLADSVVVLVVRKGNPLGITGWQSLTKKGVQLVTPDPLSSGSARWNLLEVYESQIIQGKTASAAYSFTNSVVANVVAEPSSGSKALTAFLGANGSAGTGNVLLAYEADAQAALAKGDPIQLIYPKQNILIQTPAALTDSSISNQDGAKNPAAVAFFNYLFSSAGQTIIAHNAFRPTLKSVITATQKLFPHVYSTKVLTTVPKLGGWPAVTNKFFSPGGIITKIEAAHGYTT